MRKVNTTNSHQQANIHRIDTAVPKKNLQRKKQTNQIKNRMCSFGTKTNCTHISTEGYIWFIDQACSFKMLDIDRFHVKLSLSKM